MKKMLCIAIIATIPILSSAGIYGPTSHSRANCAGFNESISWWLGHPDYRRVRSFHYKTIQSHFPHHTLDTGMHKTWRAAAYHSTEAYSTRGDAWRVIGQHIYMDGNQQQVGAMTEAINCNIYDGWWD